MDCESVEDNTQDYICNITIWILLEEVVGHCSKELFENYVKNLLD